MRHTHTHMQTNTGLNYLYYFLPYVKGFMLHLFSVPCCPQTRPEFRVRDKDQDPGRNIPEPYIHSLAYSLSLTHRNTYTLLHA